MPLLFLKALPSWAYWLVALVIVCLGCEFHGRHAEAEKWKLREQKANAEANKQFFELRDLAAEKEHLLNVRIAQMSNQLQEAQKNADIKLADLNAKLRNHTVRLSIPASAINSNACSANTAIASKPVTETRAELTGEAAEFLTNLASQCDANTRQLNAVIDAYAHVQASK